MSMYTKIIKLYTHTQVRRSYSFARYIKCFFEEEKEKEYIHNLYILMGQRG